jgi:hypothetical protein
MGEEKQNEKERKDGKGQRKSTRKRKRRSMNGIIDRK